jgi:ABC-type Mn2+/Zn2+ transport system ATPase subunit
MRRVGRRERDLAMQCLAQVGMEGFAQRQISQLSGGQQQRVFLARALAQQAQIYFMDEPFAGVDAATESAIVTLLRELRQQQKTVIVVHHDLETVRNYFDWVVLLNMRVIAAGPVETTLRRRTYRKLTAVASRFCRTSPTALPTTQNSAASGAANAARLRLILLPHQRLSPWNRVLDLAAKSWKGPDDGRCRFRLA